MWHVRWQQMATAVCPMGILGIAQGWMTTYMMAKMASRYSSGIAMLDNKQQRCWMAPRLHGMECWQNKNII